MTDVSAIGVVDPAFFVGRQVLLRWVNSFFKLDYTKVEQAASGALHCQILDACFPGKVPLHKVNFAAKQEYEFTMNWKIFQQAFTKLGVPKHVPVEKLIKGKFQDNLEMLQWMKAFFDAKYSGEPYDAEARRSRSKGGTSSSSKIKKKTSTSAATTTKLPTAERTTERKAPSAINTVTRTVSRQPLRPANRGPRRKNSGGSGSGNSKESSTKPSSTSRPTKKSPRLSSSRLSSSKSSSGTKKLEQQLDQLNLKVSDVEKERDFYLDKLREIEILCQQEDDVESALKAEVLRILYATDENDEFQAPPMDDEEELEDENVDVDDEQEEEYQDNGKVDIEDFAAETPGELVRTIQDNRMTRSGSIMPGDDFLSSTAGAEDFLGGLESNLAF